MNGSPQLTVSFIATDLSIGSRGQLVQSTCDIGSLVDSRLTFTEDDSPLHNFITVRAVSSCAVISSPVMVYPHSEQERSLPQLFDTTVRKSDEMMEVFRYSLTCRRRSTRSRVPSYTSHNHAFPTHQRILTPPNWSATCYR